MIAAYIVYAKLFIDAGISQKHDVVSFQPEEACVHEVSKAFLVGKLRAMQEMLETLQASTRTILLVQ